MSKFKGAVKRAIATAALATALLLPARAFADKEPEISALKAGREKVELKTDLDRGQAGLTAAEEARYRFWGPFSASVKGGWIDFPLAEASSPFGRLGLGAEGSLWKFDLAYEGSLSLMDLPNIKIFTAHLLGAGFRQAIGPNTLRAQIALVPSFAPDNYLACEWLAGSSFGNSRLAAYALAKGYFFGEQPHFRMAQYHMVPRFDSIEAGARYARGPLSAMLHGHYGVFHSGGGLKAGYIAAPWRKHGFGPLELYLDAEARAWKDGFSAANPEIIAGGGLSFSYDGSKYVSPKLVTKVHGQARGGDTGLSESRIAILDYKRALAEVEAKAGDTNSNITGSESLSDFASKYASQGELGKIAVASYLALLAHNNYNQPARDNLFGADAEVAELFDAEGTFRHVRVHLKYKAVLPSVVCAGINNTAARFLRLAGMEAYGMSVAKNTLHVVALARAADGLHLVDYWDIYSGARGLPELLRYYGKKNGNLLLGAYLWNDGPVGHVRTPEGEHFMRSIGIDSRARLLGKLIGY